MARLQDRVAIITGAGSGMGRATARLFAAEGAALVLADIDGAALHGVEHELAGTGARVAAIRTDVSQAGDVKAMVATAEQRFGRLDVLFNNAGVEGESARLVNQTEDAWDRTLAVNLKGVFLGMREAIPLMAAGGGGSIINTASVTGLVGWFGAAAYSASKGGVVTLTKTAALECASANIRVNAICPGVIHTAMVDRITGGSDEAIERLKRSQPLPAVGDPADVAALALFLASDESRFLTGAAIPVDGGYTAR